MLVNCSPKVMAGLTISASLTSAKEAVTRPDSCHHRHQDSHSLQDDPPNSTFTRSIVQVPDTISDAATVAQSPDEPGQSMQQHQKKSNKKKNLRQQKASHHSDSNKPFVASTHLLRISTALRIQLRNKIRRAHSQNRPQPRVHTPTLPGKKIGDRRKSNLVKEGDHAELSSQLSQATRKESIINNDDKGNGDSEDDTNNKDSKCIKNDEDSKDNKNDADGDGDSLEGKFTKLTKFGARMDITQVFRPVYNNNADGPLAASSEHSEPYIQQQIRIKQTRESVQNRKNHDKLHSALYSQCRARLETYRRAVKQAMRAKEEERKMREEQRERDQERQQEEDEEARVQRLHPMLASARDPSALIAQAQATMASALSQLQNKLGHPLHLSSREGGASVDLTCPGSHGNTASGTGAEDSGSDDGLLSNNAAGGEYGGAELNSFARGQGTNLGQRSRKKDEVEVIEFGSVYDGKYQNSKRAMSAKAREEERLKREEERLRREEERLRRKEEEEEEQREKEQGGDGSQEEKREEGGENSGENNMTAGNTNTKHLPATNWTRMEALRAKRGLRAGDRDSNKPTSLIAADGTSCCTQQTGQGVEAPLLEVGGLAATELRPLTALIGKVDEGDMSGRWERVWAALQTPVLDRLDLVSKYLDDEERENQEEQKEREQKAAAALLACERHASLTLERLLCEGRIPVLRSRLSTIQQQLQTPTSLGVNLPRGVDEDTLDRAQLERLHLEEAAEEVAYFCGALERRLSGLQSALAASADDLKLRFGYVLSRPNTEGRRWQMAVRGNYEHPKSGPEHHSSYDDLFEEDGKDNTLSSAEKNRMLNLLREE